MDQLADNLLKITQMGISNFSFIMTMIGVLWVIQLINVSTRYYFNQFGILPRSGRGVIGILLCPVLHANFEHLMLNSIFLFILMNLMLVYGTHLFICATAIIILGGGLIVWVFGRHAIHIGASGLVMGYWGFVLLAAYTKGGMLAILLGSLCLYFFSGLFFNLFPRDKRTSWESHLAGFIAGLIAAVLLFHT